MKIIVISGINLTNGGTFQILDSILKYLNEKKSNDYKIIALVNSKALFNYQNIEYIEFKSSKTSWILRLYYEYVYFYFLSKKIKPWLWFSVHDISPNIVSKLKVVYCHNPSPFYQPKLSTFIFDYKVGLFCLFYKYLYSLNIKKNNLVVVQQSWIMKEFERMYNLNNVIVCAPDKNDIFQFGLNKELIHSNNFIFFYPALSRPFKNIEIICKAVINLNNNGQNNFVVILTIAGDENNYAKYLKYKYGNIKNIKFAGLMNTSTVAYYYAISNCLLFPSKLETWGLPLTEASKFNLPVIVSDLPYAHETLNAYRQVNYFDPNSHQDLSKLMLLHINGQQTYNVSNETFINKLTGWHELFSHFETL